MTVQPVPPVKLNIVGARGEGIYDTVRRLGLGGAASDSSDAQAALAYADWIVDNFPGTDLAAILAASEIAQTYGSIWSTPFDYVGGAPDSPSSPGDKYLNTSDGKGYILTNDSPPQWIGYIPKVGQYAVVGNVGVYVAAPSGWELAKEIPDLLFTTLEGAANAAAANNGVLALYGQWVLAANTTITAPVMRDAGGSIELDSYDLEFDNTSIIAGGRQLWDASGSGEVTGTILGDICIDWWGTTSASVADSATTDAGNACLAYVAQSDRPGATVYCTKPDYYLSGSWVKGQSYECPVIEGRGATLRYTGVSAGVAAIVIIGGSGATPMGSVSGFMLLGNTVSWGVEIRGQCGVDIHNMRFEDNAFGLVLHNKDSGMFTELIRWRDSSFNCRQSWYYKRTGGDFSYHGCGPAGGVIVNTPSDIGSHIVLDADCVVYNAPLNFGIWPQFSTYSLISLGTNSYHMTYGDVTLENFAGGVDITFASGSGGRPCIHTGSVQSWGGKVIPGRCTMMHSVSLGADGVVRGRRKPFTRSGVLTAGGGPVTISDTTSSQGHLLSVFLNGTNYFWKGTILVSHDSFGNEDAFIVRTHSTGGANYGSWGAPVPTWDSLGVLTLTNANYPSGGGAISAFITATDMGNSSDGV